MLLAVGDGLFALGMEKADGRLVILVDTAKAGFITAFKSD